MIDDDKNDPKQETSSEGEDFPSPQLKDSPKILKVRSDENKSSASDKIKHTLHDIVHPFKHEQKKNKEPSLATEGEKSQPTKHGSKNAEEVKINDHNEKQHTEREERNVKNSDNVDGKVTNTSLEKVTLKEDTKTKSQNKGDSSPGKFRAVLHKVVHPTEKEDSKKEGVVLSDPRMRLVGKSDTQIQQAAVVGLSSKDNEENYAKTHDDLKGRSSTEVIRVGSHKKIFFHKGGDKNPVSAAEPGAETMDDAQKSERFHKKWFGHRDKGSDKEEAIKISDGTERLKRSDSRDIHGKDGDITFPTPGDKSAKSTELPFSGQRSDTSFTSRSLDEFAKGESRVVDPKRSPAGRGLLPQEPNIVVLGAASSQKRLGRGEPSPRSTDIKSLPGPSEEPLIICWVCLQGQGDADLEYYCHCRVTHSLAHERCLLKRIQETRKGYCEICRTGYHMEKIPQRSLRKRFRFCNGRNSCLCLFLLVLCVSFLLLVGIWFYLIYYIVEHKEKVRDFYGLQFMIPFILTSLAVTIVTVLIIHTLVRMCRYVHYDIEDTTFQVSLIPDRKFAHPADKKTRTFDEIV